MTRILPVVALLVIASTFSQFSGHSGTVLSTITSSAQQGSATSGTPERVKPTGNVKVNTRNNADCKELTPCIPRPELGPWNSSCEFAAGQGIRGKSPEAIIDLGAPLDDQLKSAAASARALDPFRKQTKPGPTDASDRWCLSPSQVGRVHTVIVTLPDPVRSHLALDFDRRVDAIQSAALKANYVLDHFWLPWTGIRTEPSQNPDLKPAERVLQRVRLSEPGLEIFRSERPNPGNRSDLILVFLVGETPTSGIDLGQLQKAVQYGSELKAAMGVTDDGSVKLLGPSFSGSIPALIDFVTPKSPELNHPRFDIVTSSATDHALLSSLAKAVPSARSVVHDDAVALKAIAEYAKNTLGIPDTEIAVISESETAYGQGVNSSKNAAGFGRTFHFPREIYRLRTVYPDAQPISPSQHPEAAPNPGLDFNLKMSPGGDDSVPSFSREELPLSQEAELLNVAESIHRNKIKLAGVLATDVFDTLFVLRFLHEFCPDTRLFVLDSDVLFVRAATSYSLEGTLAVTNYRLSTTEFPSRNAEITYNAFLALIGRTDELSDEYELHAGTHEGNASEPPLWLAVLSTDGLQPVHVFPEVRGALRAASDGNSPVSNALPLVSRSSPKTAPEWHESTIAAASTGPETRNSPDVHFPSGPNLGIGYLLFAITAAQIACAFAGLKPTAKFLNWLIEFFHVPPHADAQKACFIAISFFILAVLNIFVFFPIWRIANLAESGTNNAPYTLLAEFGAVAVFGSLCMSVSFFVRHQVVWTKSEKLLGGVSFAALICYAVVWIALSWFRSDSGFILQRSLDLSNGVSPLTPNLLALTVLYLWSLTHIRRIHLWEARRPSISFTSLDREYKSAFSILEADLSRDFRLVAPVLSLRVVVLALLLALIVASAKPGEHLAGFESAAFHVWSIHINIFDSLYLAYICLCAALLAWALARFILGWSALLNILRRLERQPIRHAFDRLPKKFYSWTPLWHAGGARRTFALHTRALECFEKLWSYRNAPGFPVAAKTEIESNLHTLRDATAALLNAEAEGKLDTCSENTKCRDSFLTAADNITRDLLIPHWQATGDCESIEQHDKDQAEKPDKGVRHVFQEKHPPINPSEFIVVAEEFVALRFVGFMRYVGVQLRNMLSFVIAGFILCVASIRSYPFLAHRTIGWGLSVVFVVLGTPVVIAFAQMDKDAILSRLSDTDPGKLDRAFYVRLIAYGGLPFLTVLASQFPAIGRFLFSWVQPAIEALH